MTESVSAILGTAMETLPSESKLPIFPQGSSSILSGLPETFSFHSSPEAFITSRVLRFSDTNPDLIQIRVPIHAKVLNRNVAIVSSYSHVQQILCGL